MSERGEALKREVISVLAVARDALQEVDWGSQEIMDSARFEVEDLLVKLDRKSYGWILQERAEDEAEGWGHG